MKDLSIVVVSFNTKDLTVQAIESVLKNTRGVDFEVIVVDNNSTDGSRLALRKLVKKYEGFVLVENRDNRGFGAGNNQGIRIAKGRYILFLNTDTLVNDNALGEIVTWMDQNPKTGIVSCSLRYDDDKIQATGGYFPTLPRVFAWMTFLDDIPGISAIVKPFHPMHDLSPLGANTKFYRGEHSMDWVTGAFFMMRREVFDKVGLFDQDYFMYMEEVDYCFRAKKFDWGIKYLPRWNITHFGGASSVKEFSLISEIAGLKVFYKKHMPAWQFPLLRFIVKVGAALRVVIFGILKGPEIAKIYAKIFVTT